MIMLVKSKFLCSLIKVNRSAITNSTHINNTPALQSLSYHHSINLHLCYAKLNRYKTNLHNQLQMMTCSMIQMTNIGANIANDVIA